jgi:hypothetical protein
MFTPYQKPQSYKVLPYQSLIKKIDCGIIYADKNDVQACSIDIRTTKDMNLRAGADYEFVHDNIWIASHLRSKIFLKSSNKILMMINDGTVLPNSKVISQVTPNGGLKPLAITNPQDTITASKSGGYTNMNANISFGVLKVDLGMGASKDIRMALLEDAEFMRQITAAVKQKTTQLMNGTA